MTVLQARLLGAGRRWRSGRDRPARPENRKIRPGALVGLVLALGAAGHPWVAAAREPLPEVAVELVTDGLNAPVFLVAPDDGSGRRFVGEQAGEVYVVTAAGERLEPPFLDLRDRMVQLLEGFDERGLLGMAFHPKFASNGLFYVTYSAKLRPGSSFTGETAYTRRLSEFRVAAGDRDRADPASSASCSSSTGSIASTMAVGSPSAPMAISCRHGRGGGVHGVRTSSAPVNDQSGRAT